MKKYACNRLYLNDGRYYPQSVVILDDKGEVAGHAPLTEETSFTEWIGGVIIISHQKDSFLTQDFKTMSEEKESAGHPLYAWHISHFDFHREELTPQSIIRRL